MRIAVLNTGSTYNRKGSFNNVHERIKHLQEANGVDVDAFLIRHYDDWVFRLLRNNKEIREETSEVDGIKYNNLWVKHRMFDYILRYNLKIKDITCKSQLYHFVPLFKDYDILSVHTLADMFIANLVKQKYGIPFVNTWHGSDINVFPFSNKKGFKTTKELLEKADFNFFVSKKLMYTSEKISKVANKDFLYTGPSERFSKIPINEKKELKIKNNVTSRYVVGYIGNFLPMKNVLVLPHIFDKLNRAIKNISFIIVGSGPLEKKLGDMMSEYSIDNVTFTGNIIPEKMPDIMNIIDVLILPSKNEGMPRVTLEALASGVHIVGSDVGGIPESIGKGNSFTLNDNFVENISNRIIEIIKNDEIPKPLPDDFSWDKAVKKEMAIYKKILLV